jgi:hypothetical protein
MKKKFFKLFGDVNSFAALMMALTVCFVLVYSVVKGSEEPDYMIHASSINELLNENFVFVNLGPAGLPDNQGYMVDYVENDTIYLIPNTEEAGY